MHLAARNHKAITPRGCTLTAAVAAANHVNKENGDEEATVQENANDLVADSMDVHEDSFDKEEEEDSPKKFWGH